MHGADDAPFVVRPTRNQRERGIMKRTLCGSSIALAMSLGIVGCATLTNDPMTPVAVSFSDGSSGECVFENKRGTWATPIP